MIICLGNTLFLGYLKIKHNHLLGLIPWEGNGENMLKKTSLYLTGFTAAWSHFLCTSFHSLTPNSQQNGQEKSHSCWSSSPALVPVLCQGLGGFWEPCHPAARGVRVPSSPLSCACAAREMVLLVLASDILPYKSPEEIWRVFQRQLGCLHLVWDVFLISVSLSCKE